MVPTALKHGLLSEGHRGTSLFELCRRFLARDEQLRQVGDEDKLLQFNDLLRHLAVSHRTNVLL